MSSDQTPSISDNLMRARLEMAVGAAKTYISLDNCIPVEMFNMQIQNFDNPFKVVRCLPCISSQLRQ
jgi:hypothetical protein